MNHDQNMNATGTARVYEDEGFSLVADLAMAGEGESSFVNDVIITKTAAYFTDSFQPKIYKVRGRSKHRGVLEQPTAYRPSARAYVPVGCGSFWSSLFSSETFSSETELSLTRKT